MSSNNNMMQSESTNSIITSVTRELNELNDTYFEEVKKGVNCLVDSKVAIHAHDKVLDDQIDEFKEKIGTIEGNIQAMDEENDQLRKIMSENQPQNQVNLDNLDEHVKPSNALSEKLIKLQAKNASIEDAMGVLKKAFDNDVISLDDYLKSIRNLAKRQCKQIIKINRLTKTSSQG